MNKSYLLLAAILMAYPVLVPAADLAGSKDPPGMKRYEGSEIIGYREPKFDEYLLPLGVPTSQSPPKYVKSLAIEGQVSRYAYVAPAGRTATELLRNYKLEFARLGLETMYEKGVDDPGWFGRRWTRSSLRMALARSWRTTKLMSGCWWVKAKRRSRPTTWSS